MNCNNCDIQIEKSNILTSCQKPKIGHVSLKCWLGDLLGASNGVVFDINTFEFKLGGEITENTSIKVSGQNSFNVYSEDNGLGLNIYYDGNGTISLGNINIPTGITIDPSVVNIFNFTELNLVSNDLFIKNSNGDHFIEFLDDGSQRIITENLPIFADDVSAGGGGVTTNQWYKTATGELRIKL